MVFRWTQEQSFILLLGIAPDASELTLWLSNGGRPPTVPPATVELAWGDRVLGTVTPEDAVRPYRFELPRDLVAEAAASPDPIRLRVRVPTWRPSADPRRQRHSRPGRDGHARDGAMRADRHERPALAHQVERWALGNTARTLVAIGAVMLVAYWTAALVFPKRGGRMVVGDATHHFVQLRSIVFDRDLRFRNEYVRLYELSSDDVAGTEWIFTDLTATGRVRNYMPIGPALLWAPLYLARSARPKCCSRPSV